MVFGQFVDAASRDELHMLCARFEDTRQRDKPVRFEIIVYCEAFMDRVSCSDAIMICDQIDAK